MLIILLNLLVNGMLGTPLYAPNPGNFSQTPTPSVWSPPASQIFNVPNNPQRELHPDKLGFIPSTMWNREHVYDEQLLIYIHCDGMESHSEAFDVLTGRVKMRVCGRHADGVEASLRRRGSIVLLYSSSGKNVTTLKSFLISQPQCQGTLSASHHLRLHILPVSAIQ